VTAPPALQARVRRRLGAFELDAGLQAAAGEVTAVFGPSGAGKSQLLAALAGASRPDDGRIVLDGQVLFDSAAGVDRPMHQRRIGWVFQDGRLFPHLTVRENLLYGARRAREPETPVSFDGVVDMLGIATLLQRRPAHLSGGERQRVAIGRALLSRPALLLMDEPLAALDLARRAEILPYLERLRREWRTPLVYVTHALSEVLRLADRLLVLEAGRVVAEGPLEDVLVRTDLPLLAGRADAATPLRLTVEGHDDARGLTRLRAGQAELLTPRLRLAPGAEVRAAALARDVLLATERPRGLSARNILPAVVQAITPRPDGVVLVRVEVAGGPRLLSAVTADAVSDLQLRPGQPVFAVVKSVAVEGLSSGGLIEALESALH
jgi:molybdate transport system ATP-binding protein